MAGMSLAAFAFAAIASVVPPQPTAFEVVNLRMTVDSCTFVPATVRVTMGSGVIRVTQSLNNCLAAGTPQVADVQLGALPAGDYRVELYATPQAVGTPIESLAFQVRDPAEVATSPRPARPLNDYTGLWYNPQESGWGLSLFQGPTHTVFGLLFVYDSTNRPEWYSLQGAQWTDPMTLTGTLFRTTGPALGAAFDASQVSYLEAGTATLAFIQAPGQEGRVRLTYSIGARNVTTFVVRISM
jgi:hypothetical protein